MWRSGPSLCLLGRVSTCIHALSLFTDDFSLSLVAVRHQMQWHQTSIVILLVSIDSGLCRVRVGVTSKCDDFVFEEMKWSFSHFYRSAASVDGILFSVLRYVWFAVLLVVFVVVYAFLVLSPDLTVNVHMR